MSSSKLLSLARDLKRRKSRERNGLFVAEGIRAVEELVRSRVEIRGALAGAQLHDSPRGEALLAALRQRGAALDEVDPKDFGSAAETESPQGVLAIGVVPEWKLETLGAAGPCRLLILDAVQDPGNVGTMVRTAAALGATATLALPGTVDLWNAKVVRSAMGAHFHHPCLPVTWDELDTFRRAAGVSMWAADASGESLGAAGKAPERLGIVLGNEGGGLSPGTRERADRTVALPIAATTESLNVAVAAGILLYELRYQLRA